MSNLDGDKFIRIFSYFSISSILTDVTPNQMSPINPDSKIEYDRKSGNGSFRSNHK